jgi:hypothetical protein
MASEKRGRGNKWDVDARKILGDEGIELPRRKGG